jgi:alkaline phosphatase D
MAISACNGGYHNPFRRPLQPFSYPALEQTARHDYDLFVHLGDQAYMDLVYAAGGQYDQYLQAWPTYLGSVGMKRVYAKAGMYCTMDDHDVADNNLIELLSLSKNRLQPIRNGRSAFSTVMPLPEQGPMVRLWNSYRWGNVLELILLDTRYERGSLSSGEFLSGEQMAFLQRTLLASPCHFKVIAGSVPMTDMPGVFDFPSIRHDRWEAYQRDREQLLTCINENKLENVWFLTGDLHLNFVSRLNARGDDRASRAREIAVTGGRVGRFVPARGNQFLYTCPDPRACLLTFDPQRDCVSVRYLRADGAVDFDAELTPA